MQDKPAKKVKKIPGENQSTDEKMTAAPEDPRDLGLPKTKRWFQKPLFWVGCVALFIGIVSISLGLVYRKNVLSNQQAISDNWHAIVQESNKAVLLGDKAKKGEGLTEYSQELRILDSLVNDKAYQANNLPTFLANKSDIQTFQNFITDFHTYTSEATRDSENLADYNSSALSKLDDLSSKAKDAAGSFRNKSSYISEDLSDKIFEIGDVLSGAKDTADTKKKDEQAAKDASAQAIAKDAADKTVVTNNATAFEQGFIAGNAAQMKLYMTSGFQAEYNFNQLTPEQRQYQYPSSFRIINVNKQSDGSYKVQINVIYKYTDNPNQYTQGYEYSVINSNSKWLFNDEKQTNSF